VFKIIIINSFFVYNILHKNRNITILRLQPITSSCGKKLLLVYDIYLDGEGDLGSGGVSLFVSEP
jgi:hypothetical protein